MQKLQWRLVWCLAAALAAAGCSADADSGGARQQGTRPGSGNGGNAGNASAGSGGDDGFSNSQVPVAPTSGAGGAMQPVDTPDGGECGAVSQTAQNILQPVDIIIGIDTSGSMDDEIVFVQQNLNAFSQQIIDSGVDVRVILIATEGMTTSGGGGIFGGGDGDNAVCIGPPLGSGMCPGDSNPPVYTHINREIGSTDILNVFISAYATYRPHLRESSIKTFVAITDDDAEDAPYNNADEFIRGVGTLEPNTPSMWANWRYAAIYCFTECPFAAEVGAVHADLVSKTSGVGGDLCLQDFAPVFDELARQVVDAASLACDWEIPPPPGDDAFDKDRTNVRLRLDGGDEPLGNVSEPGACADLDGWHYDDPAAPTRVVACPATCGRIQAAQEASIDILFGCETIPVVPE